MLYFIVLMISNISYSREKGVSEIERTLFLFKPQGCKSGRFVPVHHMIERTVKANHLTVIYDNAVKLTKDQGLDLYRLHEGQWDYELLANQVSSKPLYAMVIEGEDAVGIIKRLLGPTKPEEAKSEVPGSIRGQFVIDNYAERKAEGKVVDNIGHASATVEEALWEISVVFPVP